MQATNKLRGIVAAVSGVLLFGAANVALADTTDDLLKTLRDKGVLSEKEYDDFNTARDSEKVKKMEAVKVKFKDGFQIESGDGAHKMSVNGRIQADFRTFNHDEGVAASVADTFDIRRAYLTVKGTFYNNINFEATADFGNGTKTDSPIKYYWLEAAWWDAAKIRFGEFKMPGGLETWTSSRFIDMTERDWVSTLTPSISKGIMVHGEPMKGLTYGLSVSNGGIEADDGQYKVETDAKHDGKAIDGRVAANFAKMAGIQDTILHAGAWYGRSNDLNAGDTSKLEFKTNGRGTKFFSAAVTDGDDAKRWGLEGIVARGPVKLSGEYAKLTLEPIAGASKDVKAGYVNLSWLVTGESYADAYKSSGVMDRIRPKSEFVGAGAPGTGAWELGLRYSRVDAGEFNEGTNLNSESDKAHSWTAGVKWIVNPNTRFLFDYIDTKFDEDLVSGTSRIDDEKAINFRAQFDF